MRDDKQTLGGGKILSPIVDPMKKSQKLKYLEFLSQGDFKGAFEILLMRIRKVLDSLVRRNVLESRKQ